MVFCGGDMPNNVLRSAVCRLSVWFACGLFLAAAPLPAGETRRFLFLDVADRLLRQQLGRGLNEVQVAPTNQYSADVHRIFQVAANIDDATNQSQFPSVFRPLFATNDLGVFLGGFLEDGRASTLPEWLESNPYGVPLVIPARKGLPAFNEFVIRLDLLTQRTLEVTRPSPASRPNGTNQSYSLGISNFFGVEAWSPWTVPYPGPVRLEVSNRTVVFLTNQSGIQFFTNFVEASATNIAAGSWKGSEKSGFVLPLNRFAVSLPTSSFRFASNTFEPNPTNFVDIASDDPVPPSVMVLSNRMVYLATDGDHVLDLVVLDSALSIDIHRELWSGMNPYPGMPDSSFIAGIWDTNRAKPSSPPDGVLRQLAISDGDFPTAATEWRALGLNQVTENSKAAAIDAFRRFLGLTPFATTNATNVSLVMQAPFNPAARFSVLNVWQANDPLVHFHSDDLRLAPSNTLSLYLTPASNPSNLPPASLGYLNPRYSPWGGNPFSSAEESGVYDSALRDPGIYSANDWDFPSGGWAEPKLLGRIHRGTPWQTVYLKSKVAPIETWQAYAGNSPSHPTNDWRLAAFVASRMNSNDLRRLLSINTTNRAAWRSLFEGLTVLSNDIADASIPFSPRHFSVITVTSNAPQTSDVVEEINRSRMAKRGEYFGDVAALLALPELSDASPWLNVSGAQRVAGLSDEAYEALPSQLLALVRSDPVGALQFQNGDLRLQFTAVEGQSFAVQTTADLRTWTTVGSPIISTGSVVTVFVPAGPFPRLFYRAVVLP